MEFIFDMADVERLVRKGAAAEGVKIPESMTMTRRVNNKKSTFRVVFKPPATPAGETK